MQEDLLNYFILWLFPVLGICLILFCLIAAFFFPKKTVLLLIAAFIIAVVFFV